MATSLGSLVVSLGLNAAEFTAGLTKSEFQAKQFAQRLDKGIADGARAAGIALTLLGGAAVAAFVAVDQLAKQAANFKDLEEKTGANAEALASFSVAAQVAGTNMDAIAQASIKLTKNLTGVDDESKAAGAALAALGIPIKDFKALDPATQIEAVAKALSVFQDGAGKTAVALALFGKAGADVLPFLKELAAQGGRQVILTQAQIEASDAYSDAQARARAQLNAYAQVAATQALPAITAFTSAVSEAIKQVLGMDTASKELAQNNAIVTFAEAAAKTLAILGEGVLLVSDAFRSVGITIGASIAIVTNATWEQAKAIKAEADADIERIGNRKSLITIYDEQIDRQKKIAVGLALINDKNNDARDFQARKKALDFQGAVPSARGGGGVDRISEAQRFLDALQKQVDKTLELTTLETVLKEIQSGRLKGLTPQIESQIISTAKLIDEYKALDKALRDSEKAFQEEKRVLEAQARDREHATKAAFDHAEQIRDANRALSDEIEIITGGVEAQKRLERAHIEGTIAINEQLIAEREFDDQLKGTIPGLQQQIVFLKERLGLLTRKDIAQNLKAEADAMNAFKNTITDEFANAFEGFIDGTKSAKDAFKDFATSVQKYLTNLALHKIGDSIFGSTTAQGPDIFSMIGKLFGIGGGPGDVVKSGTEAVGATALTGSATILTEAGGALTASSGALDGSAVAQTTAAGLLSGAGGALSAAALALGASKAVDSASSLLGLAAKFTGPAGGEGLASGSNFTFGGGTWVGEHGPEFIDMPRGARVWPNGTGPSAGNGGGDTFHINLNFPPTVNTQTARQAGNFVRDAVSARARDR